MLTHQQIFDKVAAHLFAQGRRAGRTTPENDFVCLYRSPGGGSCAVGCLITDDEYTANKHWVEGNNVHSLLRWQGSWRNFGSRHESLLFALQNVHDDDDSWYSTYEMRRLLTGVANEYGLDCAILEALSFENR